MLPEDADIGAEEARGSVFRRWESCVITAILVLGSVLFVTILIFSVIKVTKYIHYHCSLLSVFVSFLCNVTRSNVGGGTIA